MQREEQLGQFPALSGDTSPAGALGDGDAGAEVAARSHTELRSAAALLLVSREVGTRTVKAIHAGLMNMNDPNHTSEPAGRLQKPVAGHTTAINGVTPTQSTGSASASDLSL